MAFRKGNQRQQREIKGRRSELWACIWLILKGYKIEKRRLRLKSGEIDIIASKGHTMAFIEVKARQSLEIGLNSVTDLAWRRIGRSAEIWMSHQSQYADYDWRYDLIVVCPGQFPRHFRAHWRP